jgi:hypothetical protein
VSKSLGDPSVSLGVCEFFRARGTLIRAGRAARASSPAKEREKCCGALRPALSASPVVDHFEKSLRVDPSPAAQDDKSRSLSCHFAPFGFT